VNKYQDQYCTVMYLRRMCGLL